ncbi:MAG TPA: helix-turn-helix domain-containing protein [Candidatus Kapabacteria bacterium]|nr:helix-turn-helix domain-containing protein [Candidatus Kapabacteria bacterium]
MENNYAMTPFSKNDLELIIRRVVNEALNEYAITQKAPEPAQELIKIDEVAKILQVSKPTVYDWKKRGLIPFYRMANKIFFKKNEVYEALNKVRQREF